MNVPDERLIVAIDTSDLSRILRLADALRGIVKTVKIGSTSFNAYGPDLIKMVKAVGPGVFLDLKLFDIPEQVSRTVHDITGFGVNMFTLHTFGGIDMMKGAVEAATGHAGLMGIEQPLVMGVTVLTSIDDEWLTKTGLDGTAASVDRLAGFAAECGLDGVVASGEDTARIKADHPELKVLVPGIRVETSARDDQKRTSTPEEALNNGADYIVVGRPITESEDPAGEALRILERIRR